MSRKWVYKRKFAFLPHRSAMSDEMIWLEYGIRETYKLYHWDGIDTTHTWYTEKEFTLLMLRR